MKNLVFVSVDDLFNFDRFRNKFGVTIDTPNFGRLAAQGTVFENAYCATPLCSPSRAAIMAGQSPFGTRVFSNADDWGGHLSPADLLPAALRAQGARTTLVSKVFHETSPSDMFFTRNFDTIYKPWGLLRQDFDLPFEAGPAPAGIVDADFADFDAARYAARFLDGEASGSATPFGLFLGFNPPHLPNVVPRNGSTSTRSTGSSPPGFPMLWSMPCLTSRSSS